MALNSGQKSVLFCDRGTLDGSGMVVVVVLSSSSAYMERSVWQAILDENGWTNVQLRDKRYDCVVHMVTAAWGAPQFYNRYGGCGGDVMNKRQPGQIRITRGSH